MAAPLTSEPIPERRRWYNPVLDPYCQAKMTDKMRKAVQADAYGPGGPLNDPDEAHPPNLVSSLCWGGEHRPALDIDVPCELIPSSTEGHFHLYFPTITCSWEDYRLLIEVLARVGILEPAYRDASYSRGQTLLRPPGVPKPSGDPVLPTEGEW